MTCVYVRIYITTSVIKSTSGRGYPKGCLRIIKSLSGQIHPKGCMLKYEIFNMKKWLLKNCQEKFTQKNSDNN